MKYFFRSTAISLGVALLFCDAGAKDIFVSTAGADSNSGATTSQALRTFAAAGAKAQPGDTVQILPGKYQESIAPTRSGTVGKPITYKRYGSSPVVLTHTSTEGIRAAIDLVKVSHIVVDGINVDGVRPGPDATVKHFALITDSTNIVIRNCDFKYANGYFGMYASGASSYITLEDSSIDWNGLYNDGNTGNSDWGDLVEFETTVHHVLIQRNEFRHGPHDVLVVLGHYTIVQDNVLDNDYRDVYGSDFGGRAGAIVGSNNVVQRNYFTNAGRSSDAPTNSFTKFEGTNNIARQNVFAYGNQEGIQSDAGSWSPVVYDNRLYNNTFYRMGGGAWRTLWYDTGKQTGNNKFINNLVVDSRMKPLKGAYENDITIAVQGFNAGVTGGNQVLSNMFSPYGGKAPLILIYDKPGDIDLKGAETAYPQYFARNLWKKPEFISANPKSIAEFALKSGSPGIDEGMHVTTVVGSGTSNRLQVADSRFFIDGFGLIAGDTIRLQGTSTTARIVAVDHVSKTLQLATTVTFTNGQGVSLDYQGAAPDIGVGEGLVNGSMKPRSPASIAIE